jgi:hypothetical protein
METWRPTEGAKYGIGNISNLFICWQSFYRLEDSIIYIIIIELTRFLRYLCFLSAIYNFDGKVDHGLQLDIGDAVQIYEGCAGM